MRAVAAEEIGRSSEATRKFVGPFLKTDKPLLDRADAGLEVILARRQCSSEDRIRRVEGVSYQRVCLSGGDVAAALQTPRQAPEYQNHQARRDHA
jgi:hypothetical protein